MNGFLTFALMLPVSVHIYQLVALADPDDAPPLDMRSAGLFGPNWNAPR